MKKKYLCCYDYGQGAVWLYLYADSKHQIESMYPELEVVDLKPEWFTDEIENKIQKSLTFDLGNEPTGFLAALARNT